MYENNYKMKCILTLNETIVMTDNITSWYFCKI